MKRKPKSYRREKRKEQIMTQFKIWHQKGEPVLATSYRVANAIGMTPSQHVIDMLNELVTDGDLFVQVTDRPGRWAGNFYAINPSSDHYHEKFRRRVIKVNKRGEAVGQMELFS